MKMPRLQTVLGLLVAWTWAVLPAQADVRLPKIFGDHMVLQRQAPIRLWGWADPSEQVTATLADRSATASAGTDGRWSLTLESLPAGGPYELKVAAHNTLVFHDVLLGEVWLCSGQSNMEWPVKWSVNGEQETAAAQHPQLRLFGVKKNVAEKPLDDVEGAWAVCSPSSVPDFSAIGYFFGRKLQQDLGVPVGMINSSWGGTICETWCSPEVGPGNRDFAWVHQQHPTFQPGEPNQASVLYNGMIHPLIPFGLRGVLWYQGEGNLGLGVGYRRLLSGLIRDWRKQWGQSDLAFLYAQLAPFVYQNVDPRLLAELWEGQLRTLALPNTGMAVLTDIGDLKDIHPKNKQEVGRRLALWALARSYGKDLVYSGPLYQSMQIEGERIRLRFDHIGGGLVAKDGPLQEFTIAGEDGNFVPAEAVIDGETIVVSSATVKVPTAVRFAWRQDAAPNLFNQAGLPAAPFRTDTLPLLTGPVD